MRTARERVYLILALLGAAAPFAVGLIRYSQSRGDLRYLWIAVATLIATVLAIVVRKPGTRAPDSIWRVSAVVLVVVTLVAAATAYLLGGRATVGVWMVSVAFGLSWAASHAFFVLAHPKHTTHGGGGP